jgi:hypothetical protein
LAEHPLPFELELSIVVVVFQHTHDSPVGSSSQLPKIGMPPCPCCRRCWFSQLFHPDFQLLLTVLKFNRVKQCRPTRKPGIDAGGGFSTLMHANNVAMR